MEEYRHTGVLMHMKQIKLRYRRLVAIAVAALLVLPLGLVVAQTTIPPTPDLDTRAHKKTSLSREAREVADEYADVLRELRSTLQDYREYLQESESPTIVKYMAKLDRFAANLDKGTYITDRSKLAPDLAAQIDDVDDVEGYIRDSKEVFPMKTYKVVMSLNRDLQSIQDLLESEVLDQLNDMKVNETDLQVYLKDALKDQDNESARAAAREARLEKKMEEDVDEQELAESIRKQVEEATKAIPKSISRPPNTPRPPKVVMKFPNVAEIERKAREAARAAEALDDSEGPGTTREMSGSLTVASAKLPVRITNKFGKVTVSGTTTKQVTANWSLEFHADSRQAEKDFLNSAVLRVSSDNDGYTVYVDVPEMDNKKARILNSELNVVMPITNQAIIENAFGEVEVDGLQNGLQLTNSYGAVTAEDIKGATTITSSMGELSLTGVKGPMNLRNAYASISMDGCVGDFDLENAYAEVDISDCRGKGTVKNSGSVQVSNHTGDMKIHNSFGSVEIDGLNGNLDIANQFQPVVVRDIKGTVIIENANSEIDVSNVSGGLSANNTFGLISAEGANGPIKLINKNGNIALILGAQYRGGNSTVRTSFGNVDLTVPQTANLLVKARTTFGDIKSFVPVRIDATGQSKVGILKLGRGVDSLSIVAENSSIVINGK